MISDRSRRPYRHAKLPPRLEAMIVGLQKNKPHRLPRKLRDLRVGRRPTTPGSGLVQHQGRPHWRAQDIVVVARRSSERLSRTPLAVSALSGTDVKRLGVVTIDDLAKVAPNLVVTRGSGQDGIDISLRGVQDNGQGLTQTPGVAVLIDGVQQLDTRALIIPFFDLDHIEVLRGPQGTPYGAASPGGVVNAVSSRPSFTPGGSVDFDLGNYDSRRGNLVLNAPVDDEIAVRLAANFNDRNGYLLQECCHLVSGRGAANVGGPPENAEHDYSVRLSTLYRPSQDTSLLLSFAAQHSYDSPYSSVPYDSLISAPSGKAQLESPSNPIKPNTDDSFYTAHGDFNTRVGPFALEAIGGYSHIDFNDLIIDNGGIIPPGGPGWIFFPGSGHDDTYSGELRAHNADPARFDWTLGASFLQLDALTEGFSGLLGAPCLNPDYTECLGEGLPGPVDPTESQAYVNNRSVATVDRRSIGIYGTGQYHITPTLEATAGGRVSFDRISQDAGTFKFITNNTMAPYGMPGSTYYGDPCNGTNYNSTLCSGAGNFSSPGFDTAASGSYGDVHNNQTYTDTKFTWKVGLDWKPADNEMFYANIATGYKPGGFNPPSGYANLPCCYQPENLVAYETGYKGAITSWLRLDSDIYYYDYSNQQVVSQIEIGNANFTSATINTPTTIYGTENLATITPTPDDIFTAGVNYLYAYFDNLISGGNAGNPPKSWAGHVLDKAPRWTTSVSYRHTVDLGDGGTVVFGVNSQFTSEYFLNVISNSQTYKQTPFTRTGIDITYTTGNGHYWVQGYASNLENSVQETFYQGNPFQLGNGNVGISEPRFYGVRISARY